MSAPRPLRQARDHLVFALLAATALAPALARAQAGNASHCDSCFVAVDTCCATMPHIQDPTFQPPARGVVETREPDFNTPWPYSVTLYDVTQNIPAENVNWNPITRYHGPGGSWNATNLGTVFGLTLDKYGNIYVTETACYNNDLVGPGGPGAIYRIDGTTGAISTFATLPNFPDPSIPTGSNQPGLGNISYDCVHDQFFVTNMEDGRIYRIKSSNAQNGSPATILNYFDPGMPDNGLPGWAPLGDRLWAVQWHANRVFYAVWGTDFGSAPGLNSIRSVALDGSGDFVWFSDRFEIGVPSWVNSPGQSGPISDLSFGPTGKLLLAERTMYGPTISGAHQSRVLEYECHQDPGTIGGSWTPSTATFNVGQISTMENAAGGIDYDFSVYDGPSPPATAPPGGTGGSGGRVWATGDALHLGSPYSDVVYGLQAFRPTGGTIVNSLLIDSDAITNTTDKTFIGDVEVPCPPPPNGKICGKKYFDENKNGVHDPGEVFLGGWTIQISGPVNATAVTDQAGNFCFTGLPAGTYTVTEVNQPGWIQSQPAGGSYTVTLPPDVLNLAFGNYRCNPAPCVQPPTQMNAWWPLDEPAGPVAHDIVGPNTGSWIGAPGPIAGMVGGALHFGAPGNYIAVPNNASLNFGTGNLSIDCWVRSTDSTNTGVRSFVDHRTGTTSLATGYALFMLNNRLAFQLGDASGHSNFLAPATSQNLSNGQWHHVAVTVVRGSATGGTLYVDGNVVLTFNPTGRPGSITNNGPLWIGQRNVSGPTTTNADIDEVEIFAKALSTTEVQSLFNARGAGKCKKSCYLPKVRTYGPNQTSITVCFNICNYDWSAPSANFSWSLAGLPVGPGCTVAGPTVFSPASGTVTVAAGACAPICVTIQKPAGLVPGQTACYQLSVSDLKSGTCFDCKGTLRASGKWIPDVVVGDIVHAPSGGADVSFNVTNGGTTGGTFDYQVAAEPYESTPDANAVRLNGLPPGEPVIGTLTLAPDQTGQVSVHASFDQARVIPIHEIILEADLDGDGVPEEACSFGFSPDSNRTVGAPYPPILPEQLQESRGFPNPFDRATGVRFTLPRTQKVSVRVYDVNGRVLRTLQQGSLSSGPHDIRWDGLDGQGRRAGAGIYFIRIETPDKTTNAKVVRMN